MHALESGKKLAKECRVLLKSRKEMWTSFGVMFSLLTHSLLVLHVKTNPQKLLVMHAYMQFLKAYLFENLCTIECVCSTD